MSQPDDPSVNHDHPPGAAVGLQDSGLARRASGNPTKERVRNIKRLEPMNPAIRAAFRAAKGHRRLYRPDRAEAEAMAKAYRLTIVPRNKPGIDADPETVRGAEIYLSGLRDYNRLPNPPPWPEYRDRLWQRVYEAVLAGFKAMDKYERKGRTDALRKNAKAYLRRRRCSLKPDNRARRRPAPPE